jgi:TetR/AcrR family acrAB operon transcriptional repressor
LFNAMMDRVTLPLEASLAFLAHGDESNNPTAASESLAHVCNGIQQALVRIATDPQTRRVFEVATLMVEYSKELQAIRTRHVRVRGSFLEKIEGGLRAGAQAGQLTLNVPAVIAAQGLHALLDGLIQNWLLDNAAFDLVKIGEQVVSVYLSGLGLRPKN